MRWRLSLALTASLLVGSQFGGDSLAIYTNARTLTANAFSAGAWALYLHNNPTPPVGNTTAQFALTLTTTSSTQATLRNFDTDCDGVAGRVLVRGTALVTEATTCRYVNWRTGTYAAARPLDGTLTLRIWCRKTGSGGTNPTLTAYLRDYDPVSTTYATLGTTSGAVTTNSGAAFAQLVLTWALSTSVPAGHQLELKLAASGGTRDVNLAYDTTTDLSRLVLLQQPAS